CTVILSNALIGSPVVTRPDILIVMSDASLNKFLPQLNQHGILCFDSSLIKEPIPRTDIEIVGIPATDISSRIGDTKSANMVMLGGWIAKTGIIHKESALQAVESSMKDKKKNLIDNNKKAILEGMKYLENKKGKDIRS
ncbi:MAG: 2-oxoacid:acceptor oxidoreductase family protein, partial [Nitrospirota bacterium]